MTQAFGAGAPAPVQGVTGGPGLPQGVASIDGGTGNVVVAPPNNVIQFRKSDVPQALQIYEMFHSETDYNRLALSATIGGPYVITTEASGSGVARGLDITASTVLRLVSRGTNNLELWTSNTQRWFINSGGGLFPVGDGVLQIGGASNRIGNVVTFQAAIWTQGLVATAATIFGGGGLPNVAIGVDGNFFFRTDTPAVALQRIYVKSAGAWVGIV